MNLNTPLVFTVPNRKWLALSCHLQYPLILISCNLFTIQVSHFALLDSLAVRLDSWFITIFFCFVCRYDFFQSAFICFLCLLHAFIYFFLRLLYAFYMPCLWLFMCLCNCLLFKLPLFKLPLVSQLPILCQ